MTGSGTPPRFDFDDLLLSRVRLGVLSVLIQSEAATFPELKDALGVTQGNLGAHLEKLAAGGYVRVTRRLVGRRTRTEARLTDAGRDAFRRHVERLATIARADESVPPDAPSEDPDARDGSAADGPAGSVGVPRQRRRAPHRRVVARSPSRDATS